MITAEHNIEAMDVPDCHDLGQLIGDLGYIVQIFDKATRDKYDEAGHFASLPGTPDRAERFCLHLIQDAMGIYDKYIVGVSLMCELRARWTKFYRRFIISSWTRSGHSMRSLSIEGQRE
jgi:hypothetical protein